MAENCHQCGGKGWYYDGPDRATSCGCVKPKPMPKLVECPVCDGGVVLVEGISTHSAICHHCYKGNTWESIDALIAWRKERSDEAD